GREHNKAGKYCSGACRAKQSRKAHAHAGKAHEVKRTVEAHAKPVNYGEPDCECKMCETNRANGNKHVINHGQYKRAKQLTSKELNRVTLPGDVDYEGCCVLVDGNWTTTRL
ncbi:hypothetical protein LCGC14_2332710, partial [marine sediment metagenome]